MRQWIVYPAPFRNYWPMIRFYIFSVGEGLKKRIGVKKKKKKKKQEPMIATAQ